MMEDLYISSLRPNEETSILDDMGTSHITFPGCGKNLGPAPQASYIHQGRSASSGPEPCKAKNLNRPLPLEVLTMLPHGPGSKPMGSLETGADAVPLVVLPKLSVV